MMRRHPRLQNIDISLWPTVDTNALDTADQATFLLRRQAVEFYAGGKAVRDITRLTGINSRQLYWLLDRCLQPAEDGRFTGLAGLLKYRHHSAYNRTAPLRAGCPGADQGFAGAFALLLERYPTLAAWLNDKISKHAIVLEQGQTDDAMRTKVRGLTALHAGFIMQCRAAGITADAYPMNTQRCGIRALSAWVTAAMLRYFGTAARAAGASRLKGLPPVDKTMSVIIDHPYQVVEFDGHRLDVRLKIVLRDPLGFEQEFEIERIWLLVILDVCTRAVLGYHLVLSREYSRYDVIKTIEQALTPHQSRTFTLPGVGYGAAGGFPSGKLPELSYATWQRMRLDNAKANLAADTMTALCDFIGCAGDAGPPHHPDDRPYIERFFGTIASTLSSRMPGYTGSNSQDLRRALADSKKNLRLFVSLTEIEELMEASIAGYNATPHAGLNGRTPLEAMAYRVRTCADMVTWLPASKRRTLCMMHTPHRCRVRGYLAQGTRPHINLFQVRYTSTVLAASSTLLGKELRIYYNSDDLRTVRAFLTDGTELGVLKAQGAWGEIRHDLQLRREIMKQRGSKRMAFTLSQEFIEHFIQAKKAKAKRSRRSASDLERTLRVLAGAPTSTSSLSASANSTPADAATVSLPQIAISKIEPQVLTIGNGFVSGSF